jgi:cytidylate kinase
LIIPEGAEVIDTSDMTVDEVVDRIVELAREAAVRG